MHLNLLGIEQWQLRHSQTSENIVETKNITQSWDTLRARVAACTQCPLHTSRTQTVFGVGNQQAKLMIIGEAPGFYEDQQGEPFVGRAGQLLNAMMQSIGFKRQDIYIANILKCRPPNNRDPVIDEVNQCTPFLQEQIQLVQPKLLLAVGRIAAHYLLKTKSSLETLRQQLHQFNQTPLIITYHPAYLLRNPFDKSKAYLDLQFVQRTLQQMEIETHGHISQRIEQNLS